MRLRESGDGALLHPLWRADQRAGSGGGGDAGHVARGARGGLRDRARGARGTGTRSALRRQGGGELPPDEGADDHRTLARLRRLPRRRHGVAQARGARPRRRRRLPDRGPGQPERHVLEPQAHRRGEARERGRAADRQVQADLHRAMSTTTPEPTASRPSGERLLTIGAVCRRLHDEFPEISISKIRYLEDQGLLAPRRTRGGYRLFSEEDLERLQTILRLQRDEFLPLRVIREELASPYGKDRKRRRPAALSQPEDEIDLAELCDRSGATMELAKELEDFGLLVARTEGGQKYYFESDADVAAACVQLQRFGIDPRHLRTFRTAADRAAALIDQLVAPALRSRNAERRAPGMQDLPLLAELAQELSQLLFWRNVRDSASRP